jgi:hypothetical protein
VLDDLREMFEREGRDQSQRQRTGVRGFLDRLLGAAGDDDDTDDRPRRDDQQGEARRRRSDDDIEPRRDRRDGFFDGDDD